MDLENTSARKIQAAWTGWRTRKLFENAGPVMRKDKAAVLIQRQVCEVIHLR